MNTAPSNAARKRSGWKTWANPASEVPTRTGATAAGRVRGRAAISQIRTPLMLAAPWPETRLCPARELREVGTALLQVGVAALLRLLAHVEQEVGVMGQLLDPGQPVLIGVEAGLEDA